MMRWPNLRFVTGGLSYIDWNNCFSFCHASHVVCLVVRPSATNLRSVGGVLLSIFSTNIRHLYQYFLMVEREERKTIGVENSTYYPNLQISSIDGNVWKMWSYFTEIYLQNVYCITNINPSFTFYIQATSSTSPSLSSQFPLRVSRPGFFYGVWNRKITIAHKCLTALKLLVSEIMLFLSSLILLFMSSSVLFRHIPPGLKFQV